MKHIKTPCINEYSTITQVSLVVFFTLFYTMYSYAQNVGINTDGSTPHASAMLDIASEDKGMLIPRIDIDDLSTADPVTSPADGLMVYNTNTTIGEGFYYWSGSEWVGLVGQNSIDDVISDAISENAWLLDGNSGTSVGTNFIGTTDNIGLAFKTDDTERMRILNDGNVGIGATDPTQTLDINGQIRIRGGSPGEGKVLTSSADGTATWEEPESGGSGTILEATSSVNETNWNGNENNTKTITVTGAEVGDVVVVNLSSNLIGNILTADLALVTLTGRVTAPDTVEVLSRVTGWVNTTSSEWLVRVIK